ncbi:SDR family NAD(P)-dependent oxidoreductase [Lacihabitans sp. CCS-44]|nr:SDR family NAD(P)-dependent oxidoreductase [Lacihabitans sp. CCS-44]
MEVKGSTTSPEKIEALKNSGINAYQIAFQPEFIGKTSFFDSEILIINIPPKAKALGEEFHLRQIENILSECKKSEKLKKILFVSSTSVYPNIEKEMIEEDANPSHFLFMAENLVIDFCKNFRKQYLVVRFGGLMGYDRNPCKYFSAQTSADFSRVNYIHQDDAVGAIASLVEENIWDETFNIVSPEHPTRAEIWATCSKNTKPKSDKNRDSSKKTISAEKFSQKSNYQFLFPDPLAFKYL